MWTCAAVSCSIQRYCQYCEPIDELIDSPVCMQRQMRSASQNSSPSFLGSDSEGPRGSPSSDSPSDTEHWGPVNAA